MAEDRTLLVPAGAIVRSGYARTDRIRLECTDRMAVGDVEAAYRRRLQLGASQPWPPPIGRWDGDTFVVTDGRHEVVAAIMLGFREILVGWVFTG